MISFWVAGRPAPQGSKHRGEHGQMRESSPHLPAWRQAVKVAALRAMKEAGIAPADRPVFPDGERVALFVRFHCAPGAEADADKLARAVGDALTAAKLWHDDRQVKLLIAIVNGPDLLNETGARVIVCDPNKIQFYIPTWPGPANSYP